MKEGRLSKIRWRIQRLFDGDDFGRYFPSDPKEGLPLDRCRGPVVNVFRRVRDNVGDGACAPAWSFFKGARTAHIRRCQVSDFPANAHVIVGGGGIITEKFYEQLKFVRRHSKRAVLWGVGTNHLGSRAAAYPDFLSEFDLVGLRDRDSSFEWVPCASCMLQEFDKPRKVTRDVVIYEHKHYGIDVPGYPKLTNTEWRIDRVLDFLGSAEVVLTSSYHGVYWSVLLGKKVLIINPFSSKFYHLRHPVGIATPKNWSSKAKAAQAYPEALKECRERSRQFARSVLALFST
jgi:hypothetical protein